MARTCERDGYSELYRDGHACDRWNMLHPAEQPRAGVSQAGVSEAYHRRVDYVRRCRIRSIGGRPPLVAPGTDGFGRSDNRSSLRNFFGWMHGSSLAALPRWEDGKSSPVVQKAIKALGIDPEEPGHFIAPVARPASAHDDVRGRWLTASDIAD